MTKDLLGLVNASGFAFQLAVEEAVRVSGLKDEHAWSITSREHGWRDGETPRFIDLILTLGQVHAVIECKRMRGGDSGFAELVFLVPDPPEGRRAEQRRWFRTCYARDEAAGTSSRPSAVIGLHNFQVEPICWESSFCIVRGASDKDKPMLDRISAELTKSADAVLDQQLVALGVDQPRSALSGRGSWTAVPIIVTTAHLYVCRFDPAAVALHDGLLPENAGEWEQVPYMRYRKSFDAPARTEAEDLGVMERRSQRSVIIVNATHLIDWLGAFVISEATNQFV
jgi:hypothetical protein